VINNDMINHTPQPPTKPAQPDDTAGITVSGHILIRDKETGQEITNKRNAIHTGNLGNLIAYALTQQTGSYIIKYMAFGNGGTSVDTIGKVIYKSPRVSESVEASATLYNRTYYKAIDTTTTVVPGSSYTDIKMTCTLEYNEPSGQDLFDSSTSNDGDYVFDEMAIYSSPPVLGGTIDDGAMLTHVIFHPVQKSLNRVIEVIYTLRIQLN